MQPLFSIIIANYNYGRFLDDAIRSVIAQNMNDLVELIICDAASTDNSVEIIKKYADGLPPNICRSEWRSQNAQHPTRNSELITWWCSEKDGGQSAAFNKGFSHARGKFLTWLNADDVLLPNALKSLATAIERDPSCKWWTGSSVWCDAHMRIQQFFCAHRFSSFRARHSFLMVGGPSSFFTGDLLASAGGIDESLHFLMDIDLWHRFYRNGARYGRVIHPIFAYRIHENSKMSGADVSRDAATLSRRQRAAEEGVVIRKRYGLTPQRSARLIVLLLTYSLFDRIVSIYQTWKMKGTFLYGNK